MDCPSEERIIRMKLEDASVKEMIFDIPRRLLVVHHDSNPKDILDKLVPLNFGTTLLSTSHSDKISFETLDMKGEARVLKVLLGINASMFVVELYCGLAADSLGLISDSIDMLADA
jgi:hypothetical protein